MLGSLLNEEFANSTEVLQWPYLKRMLHEHASGRRDHSFVLYALLNLSLWWRMWITQDMPRNMHQPAAAPLRIQRVGSWSESP